MVKVVSVRATMAAGMLTSWVSRGEILHRDGVRIYIIRRSHPLQSRIATEHEGCVLGLWRALSHAERAGELLIEAKSRVGRGRFQKWVAESCPFSYRTAAVYMQLARARPPAG